MIHRMILKHLIIIDVAPPIRHVFVSFGSAPHSMHIPQLSEVIR
jgi:hypothetical protein